MSFETNRSNQLRQALIQLHARKLERNKGKQPKLEIGSFVFGTSHVGTLHKKIIRRLAGNYQKDIAVSSLGFEMGACSFDDYLIGLKHCYIVPDTSESLYQQKCLYLLICRFANIYVLGEHSYFDSDSYSLPGIDSVDRFENVKVKKLGATVTKLLEGSGCERVYASELDSPIPMGVNVESNLVLEGPLVFDGYFSWID